MARGPRKRQSRKGRKTFRRSGSVKRVRARQNDWTESVSERDWDEMDYEPLERVMPRDERDRRKAIDQVLTASSQDAEVSSPITIAKPNKEGETALVTAVAGMSARIEIEGSERQATIRGLLTELDTGYINPVAIGDCVVVTKDGAGAWAIESVLPRASTLTRPDPFLAPRQQVVAANADQILIVSSWREPDLWPELIDRYLIAATLSEISPIVCINKSDLIDDMEEYEAAIRIYREMGCRMLSTSALTGDGISKLRSELIGKLTVVVGLSGAGKSSLMSAVQPGLNLRVGDVSQAHRQGRHTTTQAAMYKLDGGGYVADTPGIREFGLAGLTLGELPLFFPEIDELASQCRFSNCAHIEEPDCAIRLAERDGVVSASRLASYRSVFDELEV